MRPRFYIYVLYPRTPGTTLDYAYYTSHHIPLATEIWGPYSCVIHTVTNMDGSSDHWLGCVVEWESRQK